MALIALEGMHFHAYHGVYEAEQTLGNEYIVDVYVKAKTDKASKEDKVEHTINYETIFHLCRLEMETPKKLIESVLRGIFDRMKHQFADMQALKVRVRKLNPPLGGQVDSAWVEDLEEYEKECPRCKKNKFISYTDGDCWERVPQLHPATKETLLAQFGKKCLCPECLNFYAG
jgi:7,8-dihydroneopterin aldolase/epimerase/oxygenase